MNAIDKAIQRALISALQQLASDHSIPLVEFMQFMQLLEEKPQWLIRSYREIRAEHPDRGPAFAAKVAVAKEIHEDRGSEFTLEIDDDTTWSDFYDFFEEMTSEEIKEYKDNHDIYWLALRGQDGSILTSIGGIVLASTRPYKDPHIDELKADMYIDGLG